MAREHNGVSFVWFLTGAALGAAAALLLAPQSGDDTRKVIRRKADESRDALSKSGREIYGKGRELFEKGRGLADEAAGVFEKSKKAVVGG